MSALSERRSGRRARLALCVAAVTLATGVGMLGPSLARGAQPIKEFVMETSNTQAGDHPDVRTKVRFGTRLDFQVGPEDCGCHDGRAILAHLPTGLIGNPHAVPACTLADFSKRECGVASQVGYVNLHVLESELPFGFVPVFNVQPHPEEAGLLGFFVPALEGPAFVVLSARTESDYGLDSFSTGFQHLLPVGTVDLHLWGVPADPHHDKVRQPFIGGGAYPFCILENTDEDVFEEEAECGPGESSEAPDAPFLQNPTTCGVPLTGSAEVLSYDGGSSFAETAWPATTGCEQMAFNPSLTAQPTTTAADSPSGLEVDLSVPQPLSATVPSPSELRATTLTFPEGFSINPNAADGKTHCTDAEVSFGTRDAAGCPELAKIGTLEIDSSALPGLLPGAIYIGEPLPGDRYRIFLTGDGFGTHVKLAGSIHPDPQTGQMTVTFTDLPQTPFQRFSFHFFGSEKGLLATPTQCGSYPVTTVFVPWNGSLPNQETTFFFTIDSGPGGTPCPGRSVPSTPAWSPAPRTTRPAPIRTCCCARRAPTASRTWSTSIPSRRPASRRTSPGSHTAPSRRSPCCRRRATRALPSAPCRPARRQAKSGPCTRAPAPDPRDSTRPARCIWPDRTTEPRCR